MGLSSSPEPPNKAIHGYDQELGDNQLKPLSTAPDADRDELPVIPGWFNSTNQRRRPTLLGTLWDTIDAPVEERKLLFKLDAAILTMASLGYCIKNISQSAINNAFVSGMREELDMTGNQLTTAISIFYVGYCVAQIPCNIILTRVSPRLVIPSIEFVWGIATLLSMFCKSYKTLYCARFFVGIAEAGYYPGMQFIVGSFYKPHELAKRAVIFHTAGTLGSIFSGALQGSIHRSLNGTAGYAGWRWLFCIIGLISIPIAILSYIFLPQLPKQTGLGTGPTWWLTQSDLESINRRMESVGRAPSRPWTRERFFNILKSWHVWFLPWLYVFWNNAQDATTIWPFWLKYDPERKWSVTQINNIPNIEYAVAIVLALLWAWSSDTIFKGRRWPPILITSTYNIANCLGLLFAPLYSKNFHGRWYLFAMTAQGFGMSGLIMGWGTELSTDNNEKRTLVIGLMNDVAYAVHAAMPNAVWKQTDYPKSTKGLWYSIGLSILVLTWTVAVIFLQRRDQCLAQRQGQLVHNEGAQFVVPDDEPQDSIRGSLHLSEKEKDLDLGGKPETDLTPVPYNGEISTPLPLDLVPGLPKGQERR